MKSATVASREGADGLEELLYRVSCRDSRAFGKLHAITRLKMRKTASAVCGSSPDVDDVLQDAYLKIWRNAGKFDPARASAITWMSAIIRNTAIDALRTGQRRTINLENAIATSEILNSFDEDFDQQAAEPLVSQALARLPEDRRRLIALAYIDGESRAMLSRRFGVPVGTIKTWLHRGLENVRKDYIAAVAAAA
jgi:RNA polymerase sigma-70 factor, ECF subfamily